MLLTNGRIWTANPSQPWAECLLIQNQTILALGRTAEVLPLKPANCREIDLKGRLCIPGLWDAHIHFYYWSLGRKRVRLADCVSLSDMLQRVRAGLQSLEPGQWLTGWGWNQSEWPEGRPPCRQDLDEITGPSQPALFYRSDFHSGVANTAALKIAGLFDTHTEIENGVVERDDDGLPNGIVRELAVNTVTDHIPLPTADEVDRFLLDGITELHSFGITGICEQRMKDQDDGPQALAGFLRLNRRKGLSLRVNCNLAAHQLPHLEGLGLSTGLGDQHLRLGHVKIFSDGSLGSRTALMLEEYDGEPGNHGMMITDEEQMAEEMERAARLGFPLSIHAIGDGGIRKCLSLFENLEKRGVPRPPVPHRIEHVQFIQDVDIPRLAKLGLTASMQPGHILDDMDVADHFLGPRSRLAYRMRSVLESGVELALGSDAPVSDINPFYGIHGAVHRQRPDRMEQPSWYPEEALTLEQTLAGYTIGAARAAGWQDVTGSLEPGKRADLCVLDHDLFADSTGRKLADTKVVLTIFDGQIVFDLQQ